MYCTVDEVRHARPAKLDKVSARMFNSTASNIAPSVTDCYPTAAHAQSGVKQSGPSVCLSVNKKTLKCLLNARYTALAASKEHVDKENRTYFTSIMPQVQYGLPFKLLHIYRIYWEPLTRSRYYITTYGT